MTLVKVTLFPLPPPMLPASDAPEQYSQYDELALPVNVAFSASKVTSSPAERIHLR